MVSSDNKDIFQGTNTMTNWTSEDVAKKMQENKDLARVNVQTVVKKNLTTANKYHVAAKPARTREKESDFQSWVIDYARLKRWRVAHFRGAWSKDGKRFMTPVQADGAGWPDLCLVREGDIIFAELKSESGKTSPEQDAWLIALARNPLVICHVWRPSDREIIMEVLK